MTQQLGRYRTIGKGAEVIALEPRRVAVRVTDGVPEKLVRQLIAIEQACCPFFGLDWDSERRVFAVSVQSAEYEPALEAVTYALGI